LYTRLEKYLASLVAISAVCGHTLLFSDSSDSFMAGLFSTLGDLETPSERTSSEISSADVDSKLGLLYIPEDAKEIPTSQNLKVPSIQPDDASPGLLYIPDDPSTQPVAQEREPSAVPASKSSDVGLLYTLLPAPTTSSCGPERRGMISGGFLYWFAKQNGLDYTNQPQSIMTMGDFTTSSLVEPNFKWEPGYELEARYGFDRSYANFGLHFIYYRGKADGHKTAKDLEGMFPVLAFSDATLPSDFITSAEMHWTLNTALLDADLAYEIRCGSWFSLSPFVALRNAWIHQKVRAEYEGGAFSAGPDAVHLKSRYFGIGPLVGIMPKISLGRWCYFYGEASGAYLWGSFDVRQKEMFLSTETAHLKTEPSGNRWNGNFSAGLVFGTDWKKRFCGIKNLALDMGADYLFFTRQYAFEHGEQFTLPDRDKTLKLYGIHISLAAHF
jgi:hypothetical protein